MKIFVDTANVGEIVSVRGMVDGVTTNPTLMRKEGVRDYLEHGRTLSETFPELSVSLEVIADDVDTMIRQGRKLHALGRNVVVKIPIVNSDGKCCDRAIETLVEEYVPVNVTAVFTQLQFEIAARSLGRSDGIVSVFAGRIADTGVDPVPMIRSMTSADWGVQVLWASTREILNYEHARAALCDIITMTPDLVMKRHMLVNRNLTTFSIETARMFYEDAVKSEYAI